jgi:hypothetical protein
MLFTAPKVVRLTNAARTQCPALAISNSRRCSQLQTINQSVVSSFMMLLINFDFPSAGPFQKAEREA